MKSVADGLSGRIRQARRAADLTQQELADRLGVSRIAVVNWENRNGGPRRHVLPAISQVTSTSLDWLLKGDGAAPQINNPDEPPFVTADISIQNGMVIIPMVQFLELLRRAA